MNRARAKELLPIIQAFAEGKEIQFNSVNGWVAHTSPSFDSQSPDKFRIKPEPEVIYITKAMSGGIYAFKKQEDAKRALTPIDYEYIAKKFIEVTE